MNKLFYKNDNIYKIHIFSDPVINSVYKYDINFESNIILISSILKPIATVHSLSFNYKTSIVEARVEFRPNYSISYLQKAGLFFKKPVLISNTNVFIQII